MHSIKNMIAHSTTNAINVLTILEIENWYLILGSTDENIKQLLFIRCTDKRP